MVDADRQKLLAFEAENDTLARQLDEVADRLAQQGASPFRTTAYRNAAATLRALERPVREILDEQGRAGLLQLPGIGPSISRAIQRFLKTGNMTRLERLRAESAPARLFTTVAEIGPTLAAEIHQELGIETLADLEVAAWDGRLARVAGMGRKRIQAVREALAGRFRAERPGVRGRKSTRSASAGELRARQGDSPILSSQKLGQSPIEQPPIGDLLWIDQEYQRLAALDRLPRIAPRRFNPEAQAWLPILRTERGGCRYTALYSNTARAHELGTTHDWVVIYRDDAQGGGQWTVITSKLGKLKGRRVVRGRERECTAYYAAQ